MNFDYFTAAALVDELNTTLGGGRIQKVVEIDHLSLGFEVYANRARHYLYMSAQPEQPRVHLADGKLRRGMDKQSPLGLQLRRYIDGGGILAVRQPPWERIIIFDLMTQDGEFSLIVEPIERRANIVLVTADVIRECIRRVGPDENRVRQLLPGQPYRLPPPQNKKAPQDVGWDDLQAAFAATPGDKARQILTRLAHGISPQLVREMVYRATGHPEAVADKVNIADLHEVWQILMPPLLAGDWQPGNTYDNDGETSAYAVYKLTYKPGWQPTESVSAALMNYFGPLSGENAYAAAKKPTREQLRKAEKRLSGKLYSLQQQHRDDEDITFFRQAGELLLAYQHEIARRQEEFSATHDPEKPPLTIKLDPFKTPVENAQRYFEKYEKAKRSREALPDLIKQTERELRFLGQLEVDLDLAHNWTEIGEVQEALQAAGYWQGKKYQRTTGGGKSRPLKVATDDGFVIWVGRNSRQNEEVTFKLAGGEDLWLHVRGMPGAHVVIKSGGRHVPPEVIDQAASYAAYYSKARREGAAEVMVTERKHIRSIKGGQQGQVRVLQQTYPSVNAVPLPVADEDD
ncbi:MAG: NFACT family protein [Anaerolineales bacterium]